MGSCQRSALFPEQYAAPYRLWRARSRPGAARGHGKRPAMRASRPGPGRQGAPREESAPVGRGPIPSTNIATRCATRAHDAERGRKTAIDRGVHHELFEKDAQRIAGSKRSFPRAARLRQREQPRVTGRRKQRFSGREVPIERPDADTRLPRHVIQRSARAALEEHELGCLEPTHAIALSIGAKRACAPGLSSDIATRDIGAIAARVFADPAGDALTCNDIAAKIGRAAGRTIPYARFPPQNQNILFARLLQLVDEGKLTGQADIGALRALHPGVPHLRWLARRRRRGGDRPDPAAARCGHLKIGGRDSRRRVASLRIRQRPAAELPGEAVQRLEHRFLLLAPAPRWFPCSAPASPARARSASGAPQVVSPARYLRHSSSGLPPRAAWMKGFGAT